LRSSKPGGVDVVVGRVTTDSGAALAGDLPQLQATDAMRTSWERLRLLLGRSRTDMRRAILIVVAVIAVVLALALASSWGRARKDVADEGEGAQMPVYRPRAGIDPRMPLLDSGLPLRRDSTRRRARTLPAWE
jgi:hypothetical protein